MANKLTEEVLALYENTAQAAAPEPQKLGGATTTQDLEFQIRRWEKLELDIDQAKKALNDLESERDEIVQDTLPSMLDATGLGAVKLPDGRMLSVGNVISASVSQDNMTAFANWCDKHGHAEILNHDLVTKFKKGEMDQAGEAQELLRKAGHAANLKTSIPNPTLRAWVRTQMENGENLPDQNVCKISVLRKAKLK